MRRVNRCVLDSRENDVVHEEALKHQLELSTLLRLDLVDVKRLLSDDRIADREAGLVDTDSAFTVLHEQLDIHLAGILIFGGKVAQGGIGVDLQATGHGISQDQAIGANGLVDVVPLHGWSNEGWYLVQDAITVLAVMTQHHPELVIDNLLFLVLLTKLDKQQSTKSKNKPRVHPSEQKRHQRLEAA